MSEDVAAAGLAQTEMPGPPLTAQQRTYAASAAGRGAGRGGRACGGGGTASTVHDVSTTYYYILHVVHLIILDTQWYLEDWDKSPKINDNCDNIKDREKFFIELEGEIKKNQQKI